MPSRRTFLSLAFGLLPCTPGVTWPTQRGDQAPTDFAQIFSALVGDAGAAAAIGRDALTLYPDLLESGSIRQAFEALQAPADDGTRLTAGAVRARYQAALRQDFAASRIVDVHGWQLAKTEVCLFAFLALDSGSNSQGPFEVR